MRLQSWKRRPLSTRAAVSPRLGFADFWGEIATRVDEGLNQFGLSRLSGLFGLPPLSLAQGVRDTHGSAIWFSCTEWLSSRRQHGHAGRYVLRICVFSHLRKAQSFTTIELK